MKLSLRKASALQNAIQDHIKTISVQTSVVINEFQNSTAELEKARAELINNVTRREALTMAMYKIRALVGRANVESGVADLLTEAALIDKKLGYLKGLTDGKISEAQEVLDGKLQKLRESTGERRIYGYNDTIESGVITADMMESYKVSVRYLKKEKQSINDKVLELNVRTDIELDNATLQLLQLEQLI